MSFQLASAFDEKALRRLAGSGSYARGRDYFMAGKVRSLEEKRGSVEAKVVGSASYSVKLWTEGAELAYSCTCPRGDDGGFCKHCVAVGLAVLAGTARPRKAREPKPRVTVDDVREYLAGEEKAVLVELLMERAQWDEALRDQLFLRAAKNRKRRGVDVEALKEAIDHAIDPGDFVSWEQARDYASGVKEALDAIEAVLREGHAIQALKLVEHALASLERAMTSVHDDGEMSSAFDRLQELHRGACAEARPDPVKLARYLFEQEMSSESEAFHGGLARYADVLGKGGVAEYRRLAHKRWRGIPAIGPGQRDVEHYSARSRISTIMMALARMDGDVDAQVEVLKKDLSRAYDFLKIAELYHQAERKDAALEWAERGLAAFGEHSESRLRKFVAEEYHRRKRHDEAMAIVWAAFGRRSQLEEYRDLKGHADRAGGWAFWRERAWTLLLEKVTSRERAIGEPPPAAPVDHSILVEVLLWEGDVEAAWEEAQSGGCSEQLWMALAERREKEHPADAVPIYQRHVQLTLRDAHNEAYADAVKLLKRVRQAMAGAGNLQAFGNYLRSIRAAHARRRNFVRLLDRARWG